jgi:hypothetical protein
MKKYSTKILQPFLICLFISLKSITSISGQSSCHESLQHLLTAVYHLQDEKLKRAVKETQALYKGNCKDKALLTKLLGVDSLLVNGSHVKQPSVLTYAKIVTANLKRLSPTGEHFLYVKGLDNLALLYYYMRKYEKSIPLYRAAFVLVE